jgi:hypothetical protein
METLGAAGSMVIAMLLGIALRIVLTYAWFLEAGHLAPLVWLHARGWSGESLGYMALIVGFCLDTALSIPAAWAAVKSRGGLEWYRHASSPLGMCS